MTADSTAHTARATPRGPGALLRELGRALLRSPFSLALSLAIVLTGLLFGTLWGGFPLELSAGIQPTFGDGGWWTPVSALLVGDSWIEILLTLVLTLTVLPYAERLLGSTRTAVLFFVTGILAIVAGLGIQQLTLSWGSEWADLASYDTVLDPATGVFGAVLAASAFAPALFRRRIRVIGLAIAAMFMFYAGDSDSLFRFLAALLGLLTGILLARGSERARWRRSSYQETRSLVAALVAVTGLGPLIALIANNPTAVFSFTVSAIVGVDPDEVFERCAAAFEGTCSADVAAAATTGVGPFLLNLVPVALSLVAAWGMRRGRRSAWILALGITVANAALIVLQLGRYGAFDAEQAREFTFEESAILLSAALLPLALLVLLLLTRRYFRVSAPRTAATRFWLIVGAAFVLLSAAYIVIAVADRGDYVLGFGALDIVADALRRFVPPGLVSAIPTDVFPLDGIALVAYQWVGVLFWTVFVVAMVRRFRTVAHEGADAARLRALLHRGGGGTLGFMGTWAGNTHWFSDDGTGAVAYRVINDVALALSDPVCDDADAPRIVREFADFCDRQGWACVFYSFHEKHLPIFQEFGWQHLSVGEETVVPLPGLELSGKPWQKVRQPLNRGQREGITTLWSSWHDLPLALSSEISAISEEWVAEKKLPEMGFTLGGMEELKDPEVMLFLALGPDGRIQATTSWLPSWTDGRITGWTIDFMRRGDESMPGIMEFVIASAALHMKEQGAEVLSLSGAPLATKPGEEAPDTPMTRLLSWLGGVLEPAYGFTSLFRFKSKFNPRYETIYMAYADPAQLPAIGLAIGKAYLPEVTPKEYLELARTLTGR